MAGTRGPRSAPRVPVAVESMAGGGDEDGRTGAVCSAAAEASASRWACSAFSIRSPRKWRAAARKERALDARVGGTGPVAPRIWAARREGILRGSVDMVIDREMDVYGLRSVPHNG